MCLTSTSPLPPSIEQPELGVLAAPAGREILSAIYQPERSRSELYITAATFLLSIAYLLIFRRFTTMEPDEGIVLQGAQRILRGEVPYRDFFSFLTPGSFYLHALLFKIFGNSFLVPRTALAVFGGVFAATGYLLSRRVCSRGIALVAVALLTLTTLPYRFLALHNWDSSLLACLAVYCAVRMIESPRAGWGFALASFTSLTVLFEQSKGAGLGLGLCLGFASLHLMRGYRLGLNRIGWASIAAGLSWPFLLTLAYFTSQHALGTMLADWLWPLQHYSAANHVPYGYANWTETSRHRMFETGPLWLRVVMVFAISPHFLVPALPLVAVALFLYWARQSTRKKAPQRRLAYYLVVAGALSGLLLSIVVARADMIHFMYLQPLYILVLAWMLEGRDIPGRIFKTIHPILSAVLVLAFLVFSIPLLLRTINPPFQVSTRRGTVTMPAHDTALEYLQAHVEPGGTVLVYPYLPLYYYLTATFSPTGFDFFQPGMNPEEQGQIILRELASGRVHAVLFEPSFPEKIPSSWPGTPLKAIVRDPVADYIMSHYRGCRMVHSPEWNFMFMVPKEAACPLDGQT
jgi:hypothetical protein